MCEIDIGTELLDDHADDKEEAEFDTTIEDTHTSLLIQIGDFCWK